jgi:hypothetical protein
VNAKCNISSLVNNILAQIRFGLSCSKEDDKILYQHYLNGLNCNPKEVICLSEIEDCKELLNMFLCEFYIFNIKYKDTHDINGNPFRVDFNIDQFHNGVTPYDFIWTFDTNVFELYSGTINDPTLKLKWKSGVVPQNIVTQVSVQCKDKNGCVATEVCNYTISSTYAGYYGYNYTSGIGCF